MRVLVTAFGPFGRHRENSSAAVLEALRRNPPAGVDLEIRVLPVAYGGAWRTLSEWLGTLEAEGRSPRVLVLLGMAVRTSRLRIERFAINLDDSEVLRPSHRGPRRRPRADNSGEAPIDRPIVEGAPLAYAATLDAKGLARALVADGHPVELSLSAGSYVCNDLYYRALHHLAARQGPPARRERHDASGPDPSESADIDGSGRALRAEPGPPACVFVHLPPLPRSVPRRIFGVRIGFLRRTIRRCLPLDRQVAAVRALLGRVGEHLRGVAREGVAGEVAAREPARPPPGAPSQASGFDP